MKPLLLLSDSGHGGLVRNSRGVLEYTTGNKKRFKHSENEEALEGGINRQVEKVLLQDWDSESRPFVDVSSGNLDIPLRLRTQYANDLHYHYSKSYNLFYLSLHSNASESHKGTGVEIITSPGQTLSDPAAEIIYEELIREFPELKFRTDTRDGDHDKEMNLHVTRETLMPAVLIEFLFFDNYLDWSLLKDKDVILRYGLSLSHALKKIEKLFNKNK